jgi:hypothetical protein
VCWIDHMSSLSSPSPDLTLDVVLGLPLAACMYYILCTARVRFLLLHSRISSSLQLLEHQSTISQTKSEVISTLMQQLLPILPLCWLNTVPRDQLRRQQSHFQVRKILPDAAIRT